MSRCWSGATANFFLKSGEGAERPRNFFVKELELSDAEGGAERPRNFVFEERSGSGAGAERSQKFFMRSGAGAERCHERPCMFRVRACRQSACYLKYH